MVDFFLNLHSKSFLPHLIETKHLETKYHISFIQMVLILHLGGGGGLIHKNREVSNQPPFPIAGNPRLQLGSILATTNESSIASENNSSPVRVPWCNVANSRGQSRHASKIIKTRKITAIPQRAIILLKLELPEKARLKSAVLLSPPIREFFFKYCLSELQWVSLTHTLPSKGRDASLEIPIYFWQLSKGSMDSDFRRELSMGDAFCKMPQMLIFRLVVLKLELESGFGFVCYIFLKSRNGFLYCMKHSTCLIKEIYIG